MMYNQRLASPVLSALLCAAVVSVTATASTFPRVPAFPQQTEQTAPATGDDLQYLAQKGDATSQSRLIELFPKVNDAGARSQAVTTLASWHGLKAANTLVGLYKSMGDAQVKQTIITELFVLGDSRNLKLLLTSEQEPKLHRLILQRLSLMSDK